MSLRITGELFLYMVLFYLLNLLPAFKLFICQVIIDLPQYQLHALVLHPVQEIKNLQTCFHNPPDHFFKETLLAGLNTITGDPVVT